MKTIVVGAGISGAAAARVLAERGEQVLVIDSKPHIGGNCYDYYDENGICIHKYGTHIFHTDIQESWAFASRFTAWHPYMHKVLGMIDGQLVPVPFNLNSIRKVFPACLAERLEQKLLLRFGFNKKVPILELRSTDDEDLHFLAEYVYRKVFLLYTMKQWGVKPEELDPAVTGRVPVYISRDDRYFQNRWQGIPLHGYTVMLKNMLEHKNITVKLNTSWNDVKTECRDWRILYTGALDALMDWQFGDLPYRSIELEFREYDREFFQPGAVVNYPENYDFTRIGEYKYFLNDKSPKTVVSLEYPSAYERGKNEPYYPIAGRENEALYQKYREAAEKAYPHIRILGRLGDYRYYDMDKAIARALQVAEEQ
jgi:UDP-galactopyranose mutase